MVTEAVRVDTSLGFTTDDVELIPRKAGCRYELIDGELHVSTQPHWEHQIIGGEFAFALRSWDPGRQRGVVVAEPGIIFAPNEAVAPDLVWIARERFSRVVGADGKLHAAPDLAIELISPGRMNEVRDRELKVDLYDRRGVREYWIVDWRVPSIDVYRRDGGVLARLATLGAGDRLTSPLLPGFDQAVADLCRLPG